MAVDSGTYDDATIARKQKIAEAMLTGAVKPREIKHWAQGLAQMGEAALGGYLGHQAQQEARDAEGAQSQALLNFLKPQGQVSVGPVTQTPDAAPASPATTANRGVQIIDDADNKPSPLDPPSGADRKAMIATILGESANQGPEGQAAVASVIRNRAVNGGYGGNTPTGVVTAPNQFEPWNTQAGRDKMATMAANPAQVAKAEQAIATAYGEGGQAPNDPTNGALNFIAPKAQIALGRTMPAWAQGPGQDIGDHRFFGGANGPTDMSAQSKAKEAPIAAALSGAVAAQPNDTKGKIASLLSSNNPAERKLGRTLAQSAIAADVKGDAPTDEIKEYNLAVKQAKEAGQKPPTFVEFKTGLKKAGATNVVQNADKGESSFATEAGKVQAKRFDELAGEGQKARQMVADIDTLNTLGKNINTGKGAEIKAQIGPWAEAIGVKVDGLSNIQAFEAIVNRVAPSMRVPGSGAQSDFELKNFLKSLPSLGNTPEGNEIATNVLKGLQENKIRASEIGAQALSGEITRPQAEKLLRQLPDPMDNYRAYKKANPGAVREIGEAKAAPVTDGATATNPKTGERMILRGGKWVPFT